MPDVRYAVYCLQCGHLEDKAWQAPTESTHSFRLDGIRRYINGTLTTPENVPLTAQKQVPMYCEKCNARKWERPATKEHVDAYDARLHGDTRAAELCAKEDFDGLFKIPDELKAAPEIKRALSNLLGPLDGEVLKTAQRNIMTVARAGYQLDSRGWIDLYDRAVEKAKASTKTAKASA